MQNLFDNYPHATELIKSWLTEKMMESMEETTNYPEEFKEFMRTQSVANEQLEELININPRFVYDVFDDNSVYINVLYTGSSFTWNIVLVGEMREFSVPFKETNDGFSSRKEAEFDALSSAFFILNEYLKTSLVEENGSNNA